MWPVKLSSVLSVLIAYVVAISVVVVVAGHRLQHCGGYIFNGQPELLSRIASGASVALEKLRLQVAGDGA